jgi:DUF917 family protein
VTRLNVTDVPLYARGAAVLGSGGGGDPYIGGLLAAQAMRTHGAVEIVPLADVPDDAAVYPVGMMGAPTVMVEKLPGANQFARAVTALADYLGRPPTHIACFEAGGINSTLPLVVAAQLSLPLIDGDAMGRAFPELQMVLPALDGIRCTPMSLADEKGNTAVFDTVDNHEAERLARSTTVDMGCAATVSIYAMTGAQVRTSFVPGTLSLCLEIGRDIERARREHGDPVRAVAARLGGGIVHSGTVVDVERRTVAGFGRGQAAIDGPDGRLVVHFQNEHLLAERDGHAVASTPDLIVVIEDDTGSPVTAEALRYGHRVSVIAAPCDARWHSDGGLALVGPRYFGYDTDPIRFNGAAARA